MFNKVKKRLKARARRQEISHLELVVEGVRASLDNLSFDDGITSIHADKKPAPPSKCLALACAAAMRGLGLHAYDVQLAGAVALLEGTVAEMQTGEGKTLVAAMAAAALALQGKHVHVATVNDYLAARDAQTMMPLFEALGLTVAHVASDMPPLEKQQAYRSNVVYATAQELAFDYLRDHLAGSADQQVHDRLDCLIVDEADSILIDEAGTPLILSGPPDNSSEIYEWLASLAGALVPQVHFNLDEKHRALDLTEDGFDTFDAWLRERDALPDHVSLHDGKALFLVHALTASLTAHHLYQRDVDYIVQNDSVQIVDPHTGRVLIGRRWSDGIHQAIEAKEGLKVHAESPTLASITYQAYVQHYQHLAGLTGTAASEAEELKAQYGLSVYSIPTHRPVVRVDEHDRVYLTDAARNHAIIEEVISAHASGQPVLIGTDSVESSEQFAAMLKQHSLSVEVLNARQHQEEAKIIADAGRPGAITIATQMAGRGTDILLGGNLQAALRHASCDTQKAQLKADWEASYQRVVNAGGLYVIGTTRAASRRIDRQLRGRAGRQGDPGQSCFYLSLEDDFVRRFAGEKLEGIMERMDVEENQALEGKMMDRIIQQAQGARERMGHDARRELMMFDHVYSQQRNVVYDIRNQWLSNLDGETGEKARCDLIEKAVQSAAVDLMSEYLSDDFLSVDDTALIAAIARQWKVALKEDFFADVSHDAKAVKTRLTTFALDYYRFRRDEISPDVRHQFELATLLEGLDKTWQEHQRQLDTLKEGIHLRRFANENPRIAFQREAVERFNTLFDNASVRSGHLVLGVRLPSPRQAAA